MSGCQENYSKELVLHYHQLDKSLKKSNTFIHDAIINILREMEETCKTKTQYHPLVEKATLAIEAAVHLSTFIDTLKAEMIEKTGGVYTKETALIAQDSLLEGLPIGAKNTTIANEILLIGGSKSQKKLPKAVLLDQKMQALLEQYLVLLESCWQQVPNQASSIKGKLFSDIRNKAITIQQLNDQFTLITSKDFVQIKKEDKTWAKSTFGDQPLILVLSHLTAIQNQLETTLYILVHFFNSQIPSLDFYAHSDRFEILTYSPQTSVQVGEAYETEIALGAYSSKSIFQVIINQDTLSSIDGKVIYRVRPNKVGEQKYTARINITNPMTGETEIFIKDFSFHVIP